jgi:Ca-activated chloride channel family protein
VVNVLAVGAGAAARAGIAVLLCTALPAAAWAQTSTFKTGVDVVNFGVAVMDREGGAVQSLTQQDFEIVEDGKAQEIQYFSKGAESASPMPLHVGLLFDVSGSMAQDLDMARSAAIKFLNRLSRAEDMTIVDFDTEVRLAKYGQTDFPRLVERLRNRKADGWTALYDAVGMYLDGAHEQEGQKVLILYTDGGDTRSTMTWDDTLTSLRASDVTVYTIGFLQHQGSGRSEQQLRLQQIADTTGGQGFFPVSLKEIDKVYDRIVRELEGRYMLGYISSNRATDGAWRPVEIRVKRPDLKGKGLRIRTRKGYFAPYREPPTTAGRSQP